MSTINPVTDNLPRITITPISKRAKNRVNEHGEVFGLMKFGTFEGKEAILVHSLKRGWMGWFTTEEARWKHP